MELDRVGVVRLTRWPVDPLKKWNHSAGRKLEAHGKSRRILDLSLEIPEVIMRLKCASENERANRATGQRANRTG